ncbi:hypothetical protein MBLNU459_g7181t1 [Dothideomycetes sp. NU459]
MALTKDQVQIIKSTVPVLKEHGNTITSRFYSTLLTENPSLNSIFNQANQANNHQAAALAGSLCAYASHIDDLGALSPAVEHICQKHASLCVQPAQYDVVGTHLLRAMGDVLGAALTPAVLDAWRAAYEQLAGILARREGELAQQQAGDGGGWTGWREFRIAAKQRETPSISSFYLEPVADNAAPPLPLPRFLPGQYVSVMAHVPALKYGQARQYSLSDAPGGTRYRISVKKDEGAVVVAADGSGGDGGGDARHQPGYLSNILHECKVVGDVVKVSHPAGEFFLDPDEDSDAAVVLVSAGVGVTPMVSILNTLVARRSRRRISWIHATRSTEAQAFATHVRETVEAHDNISAVVFNKKPAEGAVQGLDYDFKTRMDLDVVDGEKDLFLKDRQPATYYVCGPDSFMVDIAKKLKSFGVEDARIKMEVFGIGMSTV